MHGLDPQPSHCTINGHAQTRSQACTCLVPSQYSSPLMDMHGIGTQSIPEYLCYNVLWEVLITNTLQVWYGRGLIEPALSEKLPLPSSNNSTWVEPEATRPQGNVFFVSSQPRVPNQDDKWRGHGHTQKHSYKNLIRVKIIIRNISTGL